MIFYGNNTHNLYVTSVVMVAWQGCESAHAYILFLQAEIVLYHLHPPEEHTALAEGFPFPLAVCT